MLNKTWLYLSFLALVLLVNSVFANDDPICYNGCQAGAANYLLSNCNHTALSFANFAICQCRSVPYLGSMALCYANNCKSDAQVAWKFLQEDICHGLAAQTDYDSTLNNATRYILDGSQVNKTLPLYSTVLFTKEDIEPTFRTITEYRRQVHYGNVYGAATNAVVLICIVLGMINNMYQHLGLKSTRKMFKRSSFVSQSSQYLRRKLFNPALFSNGLHSRQGRLFGIRVTIPSRIESVCVAVFLIVNIVVLFPNYHLFFDNTYWPNNKPIQFCRYIADRSGIISFTQLPMVFLFASRNNVFLYVTGWSYDRFTLAHKWISRTMFFHAMVHTIAYTTYPFLTTDFDGWTLYTIYAKNLYFQYGIAATIFGAFILTFAMPTFRSRAYELFLASHIFMVAFFLVCLWYHIEYIPLWAFMPWLYASAAIWVFDRFIRLIRLVLLNINLARTGYQSCIAQVLSDDCYRLKVSADRPLLRRIRPGAYVYIYIPSIYFWQSHPFTILKWSQVSDPERSINETSLIPNTDIGKGESDRQTITGSSKPLRGSSFELLIRPQQGLTLKLYKKILENLGPLELNVLIEGPYGHTAPMDQYGTAIFITGGVGVTASLPYLQKMVTEGLGSTQHLVFIWIIRTSQSLDWIQDDLCKIMKEADTNFVLDIEIYITKEYQSDNVPRPLMNSTYFGGRPDLAERINEIVAVSPSSVAVLACGPPGMNDEVRAAVTAEGIPYYEEAFSW
ncbi:ferric reductase like transmembrane component-domain-containing protein [Umbelopsis sp. PMI_123]|nr:ferric reductase like transmembrane component-domain-containing protein [Umbelopsis sp. PMI_123]